MNTVSWILRKIIESCFVCFILFVVLVSSLRLFMFLREDQKPVATDEALSVALSDYFLPLNSLTPEQRMKRATVQFSRYHHDDYFQKWFDKGFAEGIDLDDKGIEAFFHLMEISNDKGLRKSAFELRKQCLATLYQDTLSASLANITLEEKKQKEGDKSLNGENRLRVEGAHIHHTKGEIDYLIIGSGPAGSVIAHEIIQEKPEANVLIVDGGSFVRPGAMDTSLDPRFIESNNRRTTESGGIILRNGEAIGGGTTVNIDLAFSPLLPRVKERLQSWVDSGRLPEDFFHEQGQDWAKLTKAYAWVVEKLQTREVGEKDINPNNRLLLEGSSTARTYDLNQKPYDSGAHILKNSAVDNLLVPALQKEGGHLAILPNANVHHINFVATSKGKRAKGVEVRVEKPVDHGIVMRDFAGLSLKPGETYKIQAKNIILSAGALGSAGVLLRSALTNDHIGRGIILHPSMGIVGEFDQEINVHKGLSASVYAPSEDPKDAYYFESMGDVPSFIALIHPGTGHEILHTIKRFKNIGGFGAMLVDSVDPENRIILENGTLKVHYRLPEKDKERLRHALARGVEILFAQGARNVFIPSRELALKRGEAMIYSPKGIGDSLEKVSFLDNLNFITSAHMQGSNKLAPTGAQGVVSPNFQVFEGQGDQVIENFYVMDSSVFPTSVGANPMQAIYTMAKLFVDRLIARP